MFGHDAWRPLTVAVLVSGAVFLPQGIASAAPGNGPSCEQIRSSGGTCTPRSDEGVDGVFIGPNDLAANMGHAGNMGAPAVKALIRDGLAKIRAAGKGAGILNFRED
jgi:hypothetical protein